jgi:DNA-binding response OmpR family regulator
MPKVLVVDEEPAVCDAFAAGLRDGLGAEVETALSGPLGATMIANGGFDLAIIDGMLPSLSGLELARLAVNENIPVVLTSASPETSHAFYELDYPFLAKPFSISTLLLVSRQAMLEKRENIRRVKSSAIKLLASAEALPAVMVESERLLGRSKEAQPG